MNTLYDDAIVGAGILGLAHAYHLARAGRRVIVFERAPRAAGASVRNFGMLWPIGQPAGAMHDLARRSLSIWLTVLQAAGLWHEQTGSLHLAYHDDEAQVLAEFARQSADKGYECSLFSPAEVRQKCPAVKRSGLRAGLWSPVEACIDPREVIAGLPGWLAREYGVRFEFHQAVTAFERPRLMAGGQEWRAGHLLVCCGDDLQTLYPGILKEAGLVRCKLQMMRTPPLDGWRLGPMLAAGLTLRHYSAFADCPSLPALRQRVAREMPAYDRYGIHVLVSQNGQRELILGDSHEYGEAIEPFDKARIDDLVLDYLATFLDVLGLHVAQHWHGTYAKHPTQPYLVARPAPGVIVITGVGGAGMTLSFGLAERVIQEVLAEG
jgi:FAD dependent oxidoreductase TIGR03364